jgi:hypothetical protein
LARFRTPISRRTLLKGAAAGAGAALLSQAGLRFAAAIGPSTKTNPYVLPSVSNVETVSLLTVGDGAAGNGYRMVGIPDGLGAFNQGNTFSLLMNHELTNTSGIVRAHGSKGAFVSQWTIDKSTMRVLEGWDFTPVSSDVFMWNVAEKKYVPGTATWNRFCSGDLPAVSALSNGDRGTTDRIYLNGEENSEGRAWARIVTGPHAGEVWQLPRLGRIAFENVVACPNSKNRTIVAVMDDGNINTAPVAANYPSEVYFYIGSKTTSDNPIEAAGLTNGRLYGLRVLRGPEVITEESDANGLGGGAYLNNARFDLVQVGPGGDVSSMTPLQMQEESIAKNVFRMQRPEDGAWDPRPGRDGDFYFVTTASVTNNSRLWRLRFDDINNPTNGGTIQIMVNASKGRMFDNIAIDSLGRLLLQEDTGNEPHVSKIWVYGLDTGELIEVAHHDEELFLQGKAPTKFLTQDEESSGIIDASEILGQGWFLLDVQVHKASTDPELVEGGQLVAMYVHPQIGARKA